MTRSCIPTTCLLILLAGPAAVAGEMERVRVSDDRSRFVLEPSGRTFVPWGVNYDRDYKGRLLEDYWETEWQTIDEDFREIKQLGANVVRVHLQFGKFMESPDRPNEKALARLVQLVKLAEQTQLYLDLTGLACYRRDDVPAWYSRLSEADRWQAQARFWEAIAAKCADSPAIFCYDLMNEPVVPATPQTDKDWLAGDFLGSWFMQYLALDPKGRPRSEIAKQWAHTLCTAIRKHDRRHLITVGLLPGKPDHDSGIEARDLEDLDFISVHIYPEGGQTEKWLKILSRFSVGKPVVIEEMFPLRCSVDELGQFVDASKKYACGWISFYWGQEPEELKPDDRLLHWLRHFQGRAKEMAR
jgi:hypothetical protein